MFILIINAGKGQLIFDRYQIKFFAYNVNLACHSFSIHNDQVRISFGFWSHRFGRQSKAGISIRVPPIKCYGTDCDSRKNDNKIFPSSDSPSSYRQRTKISNFLKIEGIYLSIEINKFDQISIQKFKI